MSSMRGNNLKLPTRMAQYAEQWMKASAVLGWLKSDGLKVDWPTLKGKILSFVCKFGIIYA